IIRAADKKGVKLGKSQISQYISGKTFPRDNVRRVLADILSVDADWLGGGRSGAVVEIEQTNTDIIGGKTKMREFKKSTKLDNVLYDVRGPVVDEAARMEEAGTQVIKLNIGN